jgi:predicted HAD superfamily hydrolase
MEVVHVQSLLRKLVYNRSVEKLMFKMSCNGTKALAAADGTVPLTEYLEGRCINPMEGH